MSFAERTTRPVLVTFLMVVVVIVGILQVIAGVFLMVFHRNAEVVRAAQTTPNNVLWAGIAAVLTGLIYLAVAQGLGSGNGVARFLVALVSVVNIAFGVLAIFSYHGQVLNQAIAAMILGFILLLILYSPQSNAFFRSN